MRMVNRVDVERYQLAFSRAVRKEFTNEDNVCNLLIEINGRISLNQTPRNMINSSCCFFARIVLNKMAYMNN